MDAPLPAPSLDLDIDILGQQPALGIYTQIALIYELNDAVSQDTITQTLRTGLERLSKSFPWVAGQIVCEGGSEGITGTYRIRPFEPTPTLAVRDYTNDTSMPTYSELQAAHFPFRMLDESKIAVRNTIPGTSGEKHSTTFPCLLIQINYINGGIILTFNAQHQTMDVIGQESAMRWLSKACRGEAFTDEELRVGNLTRHDIVPLVETAETGPPSTPAPVVKNDAADESSAPPEESASMSWANFAFSPEAQAALKKVATETLPPSCEFVSTDDALTAFTWQSVVRARLPRHSPEAPCKTSRAVDARRYFDVPPAYPGMFQNLNYHHSTMGVLASAALGIVAAEMRADVDPKTSQMVSNTQKLLTALARAKDKTTASFMMEFDLDKDILLSSWIKVNCAEMDFGFGAGGPVAIRRPQFIPFQGLGYFLPKAKDGEVVLGICLKDVDLEKMRQDKEFMKYARYFP